MGLRISGIVSLVIVEGVGFPPRPGMGHPYQNPETEP